MNDTWVRAAIFALLLVSGRLLSNWFVDHTTRRLPIWVSLITLAGYVGLIGTFIRAALARDWWGCLSVTAIWAVTHFVPSTISKAIRSPDLALVAAYRQANQELEHVPPGPERLQAFQDRVGQIMQSWGYEKKNLDLAATPNAIDSPESAHKAAIEQAFAELSHLPRGPEHMEKTMERADQIMLSWGYEIGAWGYRKKSDA